MNDPKAHELPVDELTMMRLVDGELTASERIKVLQRLESQTEGWRDCALAFVEDQAWRQAMTTNADASETAIRSGHTNTMGTLVTTKERSTGDSRLSQPPQSQSNSGMTWLAIAAAMLLAFGAGSWTNSGNRSRVADGKSMNVPVNVAANDEQPRFDVADGNDMDHNPNQLAPEIAAMAQDNGIVQDKAVMILDRDFWNHESSIPKDFREKVEALGAKIERSRGLMPVRTNDGRDWIVPYEDVRVVPVNYVNM